jgi:predicted DNA-binding transcriptional regulator YafY
MASRGQSGRGPGSAQLARQWAILRLLGTRAYSILELANELGTSKSSVQRDITTLQQHFMIVAHPVGQQKRVYRLARPAPALSVRVSRDEIRALEVAIEKEGESHARTLESLAHKLRPLVD